MYFRPHYLSIVMTIVCVAVPSRGEERAPNNTVALAGSGSAVAAQVVEVVRAMRAGTMVELLVKPGDVVRKGQLLGNQEADQAKLNLDTARAALEAKGTLDQMFAQYQALTVSREEMEEAVHKRTAQKSRLRYAILMEDWARGQFEAQQDIKKVQKIYFDHYQNEYEARFFHAPVDGVIAEVKAVLGQAVGVGATVFTISCDSHRLSPVSAAVISAIQDGKPAPLPAP